MNCSFSKYINTFQGFSLGFNFGGYFGQNGKKLPENFIIKIFWGKTVEGHEGDRPTFGVVKESPQSPPTGGNPALANQTKYVQVEN